MVIELCLKETDTVKVVCVYFPGGRSTSESRSVFKIYLRKLLNIGGKFLICGYLNGKHKDSVLDFILTNAPQIINHPIVSNNLGSDHFPALFSVTGSVKSSVFNNRNLCVLKNTNGIDCALS